MISMLHETGASDMLEVAFANAERAAQMLRMIEAETGEKSNITPEAMVHSIKGKRIKVVATEIPFIESVVNHTEKIIVKVFSELNVKILVSPPGVGFILSDNPLTMVPNPKLKMAGFKSPGTFVFMPLTRNLCLRLGQPGSGKGLRKIDRETVRLINENTAINSDRFVMGPSKIQIESVTRRSGSAEVNTKPRWITIKTLDRKGGIFRELIAQPRQFHYLEL
jgi:hypothetical protein